MLSKKITTSRRCILLPELKSRKSLSPAAFLGCVALNSSSTACSARLVMHTVITFSYSYAQVFLATVNSTLLLYLHILKENFSGSAMKTYCSSYSLKSLDIAWAHARRGKVTCLCWDAWRDTQSHQREPFLSDIPLNFVHIASYSPVRLFNDSIHWARTQYSRITTWF